MSPLDDEDDQPIGRPMQSPPAFPLPTPRATAPQGRDPHVASGGATAVENEPRPDEGLGRPMQRALEAAPLNEDDFKRIKSERAREDDCERRRIEELLASDAAVVRLPAFLAHPLVVSFFIAIAALLGLFVFAQISSTLAALASLPDGWRYTGYFGLGLLMACVFFALGRCAVLYLRYRTNRPVTLRGLEQLSQRTRLRWLVHEKKSEARQHLAAYLQAFPIGLAEEAKFLRGLGLSEENLRQLHQVRADLLDMNRFASNDAWFDRFGTKFQAVLDELAEARIAYYARRVAVTTAVSPNALVDSLLTFYCSFMTLGDLCRIYNLRVDRLGTVMLLGHVFFNAYVAGQLNELESVMEAGLDSFWQEAGVHLGSSAVDKLAGASFSKLGARATSGYLNYLLLRRLGRYAAKSLRPVQVR
jgi:uncharacterized membrane protein YcjF (UPF0283 family)